MCGKAIKSAARRSLSHRLRLWNLPHRCVMRKPVIPQRLRSSRRGFSILVGADVRPGRQFEVIQAYEVRHKPGLLFWPSKKYSPLLGADTRTRPYEWLLFLLYDAACETVYSTIKPEKFPFCLNCLQICKCSPFLIRRCAPPGIMGFLATGKEFDPMVLCACPRGKALRFAPVRYGEASPDAKRVVTS